MGAPSSPFDFLVARGPVAELTDLDAWVAALLDVESALARAAAAVGLVPASAAEAVVAACASGIDPALLFAAAAGGGNPVIPLVSELVARVDDEASVAVHLGATSQDVLDTATMLVARRVLGVTIVDLTAAADRCATLAVAHRATPIIGRTLLQHAAPTTFGLIAAGWMAALDRSVARLATVSASLPAQLGGAVGTLATYGERSGQMLSAFATELDLVEPDLPWHADRWPVTALATALGASCATAGSVALDIVLLAQSDVAEVGEVAAGAGSSSALPHKHNPIAATSARAAAMQAPGLVANLLSSAGGHELQRAAGAWHAEWPSGLALLRAGGSAASWLTESLGRLVVHVDRMAVNLDRAGGHMMAGAFADELAPWVGRAQAHTITREAVERAARHGTSLAAEVAGDPGVTAVVSLEDLPAMLDPRRPATNAAALVDRALARRTAGAERTSERSNG